MCRLHEHRGAQKEELEIRKANYNDIIKKQHLKNKLEAALNLTIQTFLTSLLNERSIKIIRYYS